MRLEIIPHDINTIFLMIQYCLVFSFVIQDAEYLSLSCHFSSGGVWDWELLKKDFNHFPMLLRALFDLLFSQRRFMALILIRSGLGFSSLIWPNYFLIYALLFLLSLFICIRWKGAFNGGSDYMGLMLLMILTVYHLPFVPQIVAEFLLYYISFQLILSYFWAGVVKVKLSTWRRGVALPAFLNHSLFAVPIIGHFSNQRLAQRQMKIVLTLISWLIISWELSFPLAVVNLSSFYFYLVTAMCFHLMNFYVLGLNRFVWAWLAAYPALYFSTSYLIK